MSRKKPLAAVKTLGAGNDDAGGTVRTRTRCEILKTFHCTSGAHMPRYLTQHTLACLTRQGAENLAQRMQSGGTAHAERVLVNMLEGKMFVEFRAESREVLEAWLKTEGMHFDWLVRIEWETRGPDGKLHSAE
jgi:hypothetical protein